MNIGDSRLYYGARDLCQITVDHSYVEELVQAGAIKRDQSRLHPQKNLITRAAGAASAEPDFFQFEAKEGYLLLCSDGLTNMLEDRRIAEILSLDMNLDNKVATLVEEANLAGGKDNITVLVIEAMMDEVKVC